MAVDLLEEGAGEGEVGRLRVIDGSSAPGDRGNPMARRAEVGPAKPRFAKNRSGMTALCVLVSDWRVTR